MKTVSITDKRKEEKATTSPYETVTLSIHEDGVEHLMGTLTNLYSRPVEAVFREYVSNGLDSHLKAGQTAPVEVTVSNHGFTTIEGKTHNNTGFLEVKDHGVGMDKDDIVNVYSRYASSTKRDSNEQIGAFGLGAKSALAIADRFDVSSVKNGVKLDFFIEKNNRGVGVVHFVSEEKTTENSGVTVRIPLTSASTLKAMETFVATNEFFKTWPVGSVTYNGAEPDFEKSVYNEKYFMPIYVGTHPLAWVSKKLGYRSGSSGYGMNLPSISIAGIRYSVERANGFYASPEITALNETPAGSFIRNLMINGHTVILNVPIGSVDLTPSREEIMMTSKTITAIKTSYETLFEEVPFAFRTYLNSLKTTNEAWGFYARHLCALGVEDTAGGRHGRWQPAIKETFGIKYGGQAIPNIVRTGKLDTLHAVNASTWQEKWFQVDSINLLATTMGMSDFSMSIYYGSHYAASYTHILVYGTKNKSLEEDRALITRNARSYALANGATTKYVNIYHTRNATPPESVWLEEAMLVVNINDLETVAKKYRSDLAKSRPKSSTTKTRDKAIHYGVKLDDDGEIIAKRFTAEEISEAKKVIFVPQTDWSEINLSGAFQNTASSFWQGLPELEVTPSDFTGGQTFHKQFFVTLTEAFPDALVILLPNTRSLNPVQKANPNGITLLDYVNAKVQKISKNAKKQALLESLASIHPELNRNNSIIQAVGENNLLDRLENPQTKELFKEYYNRGELYSLVRVAKLFIGKPANYRPNRTGGQPIDTAILNVAEGGGIMGKYKVLAEYEFTSAEHQKSELLVKLINTIDAS